MMEQEKRLELEGTVENIVYQNPQNGYCVFEITASGSNLGKETVCTGIVPGLAVGETVRLTGQFVNHPTYGPQFNVALYEKALPNSCAAIEKYLASGIVRGVRERLAKKIVQTFGADTFTVIEDYPEKLTEIKGINLEKAMSISAVFHEQAAMRKTILYMQNLGISNVYAQKIYKKYKENTVGVIQRNPYTLADDIFGIGFKLADAIAQKAGIAKDAPERVEAGVKYVLSQASSDGHVYLPTEILCREAAQLLELPSQLVTHSLAALQIKRTLWQEHLDNQSVVYLNSFYYAENSVAKRLVEMSRMYAFKSKNLTKDIAQAEKDSGIKLADKQRLAVTEAMSHGVLVITGGPGTGKTTTINTIITIMNQYSYGVELAAPTGRAAKRMSEATGMDAKTIHRLLEISFVDDSNRAVGQGQSFGRNKENPIEADVVIIDESSMVDILLMNSLLAALEPGTRLILVGDMDQLPSVGPGNVLKDIIKSGCVPVVRLDEIFRQAAQSAIVQNAHRINRGEYPVINEENTDFFFMQKLTADDVVQTILQLVTTRLPKYKKCDPIAHIQVLCPMRKSPLGVHSLNTLLQERLNPPARNKKECPFRTVIFREGDKVMQIKNNYNLGWEIRDKRGYTVEEGAGVFNGDVGIIKAVLDDGDALEVLFDDNRTVTYDTTLYDELELAYAITIHKSQGSEYRVVVIPVHSGPPMLLSRKLLYTGVTRAKELTVLVGLSETLHRMVDNQREDGRFSALDKRLADMKAWLEDSL